MGDGTDLKGIKTGLFWGWYVVLGGLITYILLAIYCHDEHQEHVSVKRLREICIKIRNEMSLTDIVNDTGVWLYQPPGLGNPYAIT